MKRKHLWLKWPQTPGEHLTGCQGCGEQDIYSHEASLNRMAYLTNWPCDREKYLVRQCGDFVSLCRSRWPNLHLPWTRAPTRTHLMCCFRLKFSLNSFNHHQLQQRPELWYWWRSLQNSRVSAICLARARK